MYFIKQVLKLIRIKHWVKNSFILSPLFFAAKLDDIQLLKNAVLAFLSFSLIASTVYVLNDYLDREDDRKHKTKKFRPLASGTIKPGVGLSIASICFGVGVGLIYYLPSESLWVVSIYFTLNVLYSFKLKRVPIIDFIIVALGFVIRVIFGSLVCHIFLTHWIILMVFLVALFMAIAKRRDDVRIYELHNKVNRAVVKHYNLEFMNANIIIVAAITMVAYLMFTTIPHSNAPYSQDYLYVTFLWVLLGFMRYLQIIFVFEAAGSPVSIFYRDRFMQVVIILWIINFGLLIY